MTLFSLANTRAVFDRIRAGDKELVVVDSSEHLVFTEALEKVLPVLLPRLHPTATAAQVSAPAAGDPVTTPTDPSAGETGGGR